MPPWRRVVRALLWKPLCPTPREFDHEQPCELRRSVPRVNGGCFPRCGIDSLQAVAESCIPIPGKETAQQTTVCRYTRYQCYHISCTLPESAPMIATCLIMGRSVAVASTMKCEAAPICTCRYNVREVFELYRHETNSSKIEDVIEKGEEDLLAFSQIQKLDGESLQVLMTSGRAINQSSKH